VALQAFYLRTAVGRRLHHLGRVWPPAHRLTDVGLRTWQLTGNIFAPVPKPGATCAFAELPLPSAHTPAIPDTQRDAFPKKPDLQNQCAGDPVGRVRFPSASALYRMSDKLGAFGSTTTRSRTPTPHSFSCGGDRV
jgi:hypothetical protein